MSKLGYKALVEAAEAKIRIISAGQEFWIDPESPYHHAIFAEPKEFVFFCNLGWRSALAADIAQQMGLETCHIEGGYEAWKAAGGKTEERKRKHK